MADVRAQAFAWHRAGNLVGAEQLYRQLLAANPHDIELSHFYAVLLSQTGRERAALTRLQDVLERAPTRADSWLAKALVCRRLGRGEDGLRAARLAVQHGADDAAVAAVIGSLQVIVGDIGRGEASLREALERDPSLSEAWHYLGIALHRQHRWKAAMAAYRRALAHAENQASIHYNIALCAEALGDFEAALAGYSAALELAPDRLDACTRLANAQALLCDFAGEADSVAKLDQLLAAPQRLSPDDQAEPFVLAFLPLSAGSRQCLLQRYVQKVEREAAGLQPPVRRVSETADSDRPLRIGYLSPDFGDHAVGGLIQDVFAAHDRRFVTVYGYSLQPHAGPVADAIRAGCDVFRDGHDQSTQALAETIAADGIDVLVDLGGFTLGARPAVLALRPAPVQMSYLGFVHSTGAPWMDYLVLDTHVAPVEDDGAVYSEAIIRLPGTLLPAPSNLDRGTPDRRRFGLPEGVPLFASFNNSYKWDAELQAAFFEIARQLPDARFVIYLPPPAQTRFLQAWNRLGGRPESLLWVPKLPPAEHAHRAASCDLFLDAFRYGAGATGMAAVAAGLPILCREGRQPAARMGVSLNRFLGLEQLICPDTPTYVERAVELGRGGTRELKQQLATAVQSRGLLNPSRTARGLEAAYLAAWQRHSLGLSCDGPEST
jgi:predicted O-linked N-acetylglucosamine transferase (SPINDLY family)